jgi:hypothetical protein
MAQIFDSQIITSRFKNTNTFIGMKSRSEVEGIQREGCGDVTDFLQPYHHK